MEYTESEVKELLNNYFKSIIESTILTIKEHCPDMDTKLRGEILRSIIHAPEPKLK